LLQHGGLVIFGSLPDFSGKKHNGLLKTQFSPLPDGRCYENSHASIKEHPKFQDAERINKAFEEFKRKLAELKELTPKESEWTTLKVFQMTSF